jgi:hypothetical protein
MDLSRRTLLQTATMASLTIPAVAATQTGNSVAIRDQILLAPDILYFNAAKIGPAFHSAITAQQRHHRPAARHRGISDGPASVTKASRAAIAASPSSNRRPSNCRTSFISAAATSAP